MPDKMTDTSRPWKEADGDNSLALQWNIDQRSLVWEIGGFEGRWAEQISLAYDPFLWIFEPQKWAVERMEKKFHGKIQENRIAIVNHGLWVMDCKLPLYHFETDGASLVHPGAHSEVCEFEDIYDRVMEHDEIDLALMNIEGAEFVLLPYMLANDLMEHFRYFWCQFHPGLVTDGEGRFLRISDGMRESHKVLWNYYPTALAWERK